MMWVHIRESKTGDTIRMLGDFTGEVGLALGQPGAQTGTCLRREGWPGPLACLLGAPGPATTAWILVLLNTCPQKP